MKADAFRYDGKRALVVGGATGMGAAAAELVQDLGAEVIVMDFAPVTLGGREGDRPRPARQGEHRRRHRRVRRADPRAVLVRGRRPTARPGSRRSTSSATATSSTAPSRRATSVGGARSAFISSTAGLGWRKHLDEVKEYLADARLRLRRRVDRGEPRQGELHRGASSRSTSTSQSRALRAAEAGHPRQRDPARPDRHAARPGQRRDVAGLRYRLPRRRRRSRRRGPTSRPARSSSSAATPPRYVSGEILIVDAGFTGSGVTGAYETAAMAVEFMENM